MTANRMILPVAKLTSALSALSNHSDVGLGIGTGPISRTLSDAQDLVQAS
jgi:hypothetical protein